MKRITQNLFEEIQKITSGPIEEKELKHDEDKDGDEDAADYMMKRRKAGGQSHAQAHAATRKHNEETEMISQEEYDSLSEEERTEYEAVEIDEASYSAKAARAGKDIGKPGKMFAKIASSAAKRYGSKKRGEKVAGAVLANLRKEEVELEEGITETIIKHDDFVLEITNNPTFADFLNAAKSFVDNEEDAVVVAEAFYANKDESIIIEAFTRSDIESKVDAHRKAGHSVTMPKYSTKEGKPYAEYVVSDKETKVRRRYIHHGDTRRVENMGTPGKKDKGEE